jgi:hypothetical protein
MQRSELGLEPWYSRMALFLAHIDWGDTAWANALNPNEYVL